MTRPRIPHPFPRDRLLITRQDNAYHYLSRVLRIRPGEEVALFCGDGVDYVYRVENLAAHEIALVLQNRVDHQADPNLRIVLLQAVLKAAPMAEVVRGVVGLGVSDIIPFVARHSVARPDESKVSRWQVIADETVRQCGRTRSPTVGGVAESLAAALEHCARGGPTGLPGILFHESADRPITEALDRLQAVKDIIRESGVMVVLGPEGGLANQEIEVAGEAGLITSSLGPRTLRAELATMTAIALIQHRFGDLT